MTIDNHTSEAKPAKMRDFELWEDNAGYRHMCLLDDNGRCEAIYTGWEHLQPGEIKAALDALKADPDAWWVWDGNIYDTVDRETHPIADLYDEISGSPESTLLAWADDDNYQCADWIMNTAAQTEEE